MSVKHLEAPPPRDKTKRPDRTRPRERAAAQGLCRSCAHSGACDLPTDARRPVVQCEEFAPFPSKPLAPPEARASRRAPRRPEDADASGLLGLCRSCACSETCTFPKPPSGVWQCEEYE